MKASIASRSKRLALLRCMLVGALVLTVFLFLRSRKELLIREATRFLETSLSRGSDMEVHIGRIGGNLFGFIRFEDVVVEKPWLPKDQATFFSVKQIEVHYRFLDFLSKKFDSKLLVVIKKPQIFWRPSVRLRKSHSAWMIFLREWVISEQRNIALRVEDLAVALGGGNAEFSGIRVSLEPNAVQLDFPVRHLTLGGADISSVIHVDARYEMGMGPRRDLFRGQISTQGTVIDLKPIAQEAVFDFTLFEDSFRTESSNVLGGVKISASVDFAKDGDLDLDLTAANYPLSNLSSFLRLNPRLLEEGRVDLDIHLAGNPVSPALGGRVHVTRGWIGKRRFKALDMNLEGIYPTVRIANSRILLDDGSVMRFADKVLEVRSLAKGSTYDALVSEAQQDTVVWGDWEFKRPKGPGDQPEIGFEYRLKSKDSLKVGLREDEEFVGVEHKTRF